MTTEAQQDEEAAVRQLEEQLAAERKQRIEGVIKRLVGERRMTEAEVPKALARAIADESFLAELALRPQAPIGIAAPILMQPAKPLGGFHYEVDPETGRQVLVPPGISLTLSAPARASQESTKPRVSSRLTFLREAAFKRRSL